VSLDGKAYLFDGVLRVTKPWVRQGHARTGTVGSAAINEEGKDGMIIGRCGDFYLPPVAQLVVEG
jgi:hypothetical protein